MKQKLRSLVMKYRELAELINSKKWRLSFLIQSFLWTDSVYLDKTVKFLHPVKFQGYGRLLIEKNVVFGYALANASSLPIVLQPRTKDAYIRIGENTGIVNGTEIISQVSIAIGKNCLIGARTLIIDSDFHGIAPDQRRESGLSAAVIIEDNVWIGSDVTILKGVIIGQDAVAAACSVITKNVPPGAIVAGNPMRVIGSVYER